VILAEIGGERMGEGSGYVCRGFRKGDEDGVKSLIKRVFGGFLEGDYWGWKYERNPNFDPSLVVVAEEGGKIVGCNHWLVRDLKFSGGSHIKTVLGADIAVDPEHRRKGIGKSLLLYFRSSKAFRDKQVVFSYMFPNPDVINPLYRPAAFYIKSPNFTARYAKILNWNKFRKRLEAVNKRIMLDDGLRVKVAALNMGVLFRIKDAPALALKLDGEGIRIDDDVEKNPDVVFSIGLGTLNGLGSSKRKFFGLIKAWLSGKLGINGSLRSLVKLSRNLWVFSEILGFQV
jgi:GNAT superfamily N-acetyltransferase